ncbi:hypothetical protein ACFL4A_04345, partial [bacterium]
TISSFYMFCYTMAPMTMFTSIFGLLLTFATAYFAANFKDLMYTQDMIDSIEQYKWIHSEKNGGDIGYQKAVEDWHLHEYDEYKESQKSGIFHQWHVYDFVLIYLAFLWVRLLVNNPRMTSCFWGDVFYVIFIGFVIWVLSTMNFKKKICEISRRVYHKGEKVFWIVFSIIVIIVSYVILFKEQIIKGVNR